MTASQIILGGNLSTDIIEDTSVTSTGQDNVTGAAAVFFGVFIDNTANSAASYVKIYNHANPTIGTTDPDFVFICPASSTRQYTMAGGTALSAGLSYACTTSGGTAGTSSPSSAVLIRILAT
tara:strand:- start:348 stop:713 length:366 start_codon:yes stop_codon:yes gene_type:complete